MLNDTAKKLMVRRPLQITSKDSFQHNWMQQVQTAPKLISCFKKPCVLETVVFYLIVILTSQPFLQLQNRDHTKLSYKLKKMEGISNQIKTTSMTKLFQVLSHLSRLYHFWLRRIFSISKKKKRFIRKHYKIKKEN